MAQVSVEAYAIFSSYPPTCYEEYCLRFAKKRLPIVHLEMR
jgi:hypothetical protein